MYLSSSEWVSNGHPDRVADAIASKLINEVNHKDKENGHCAVEVFLTKDSIIFGGEITSTLNITNDYLKNIVKEVLCDIGYNESLRNYFTKEQVLIYSDYEIINKINRQSPSIAIGTTNKGIESGFNDQGIMFSSADNVEFSSAKIANEFGTFLWKNSKITPMLGVDIKVIVTEIVKDDGFTPTEIDSIIVAIPYSGDDFSYVISNVKMLWNNWKTKLPKSIKTDNIKWTINGTGEYKSFGSIADTSMTGRKISVNHPSAGPIWCNKMIGGGSLVKPLHASDFFLNVMCRFVSNIIVYSKLSTYCVVGVSCAIGQQNLNSLFIKGDDTFSKYNDKVCEYFKNEFKWDFKSFVEKFNAFDESFDFYKINFDNFFFGNQPWENKELIRNESRNLLDYLN